MEGHLARAMQLARQLGARSFEASVLEMKGRMLLDTGRRKEAADMLQEALAILREVGTAVWRAENCRCSGSDHRGC